MTTSVEETAGCGLAPLARRPVLLIAAAVGAVLVAVSPRYGYFGDELYFLEAGRHLAWSYADQPPLLPLLARGLDVLTGGSLVGLRLLPALVTAAGVLVTALLARELSGGRQAQVLAAALAATSTFLLGTGHLLATSTLDPWLWAVCTWLLVRWVRTGNDRLLLWLGLVTAVALQTKYLIVGFWALVVLTALIAGPRALPARPRLWLAGGFAVLTSVPALLWQAEHGWPQLAMNRQVAAEQQAMGGMLTFLPLVLLCAGALAGAVGVCYGVLRLLNAPGLRPYAFLGLTAIGVTALFWLVDGRPYYVAGMFPLLWAAAATGVEQHRPARWWRWALSWPAIALSAVAALNGLPVKPVTWNDDHPAAAANLQLGEVGWPQYADDVAAAYRALPAEQRHRTVILTGSYWEAAALARFGPPRGLPEAYSAHRGYWYFGSPPEGARDVLYLGDPAALAPYFTGLRKVGQIDTAPLGVRTFFDGAPIWLATDRQPSWATLWTQLRTM